MGLFVGKSCRQSREFGRKVAFHFRDQLRPTTLSGTVVDPRPFPGFAGKAE
jgi:hypothetical protein